MRGGAAIAVLAVAVFGSCDRLTATRLVVVVVVDQMRADYVPRFGPELRHGLAEILDDGLAFTNGQVGYAMAFTASGHATIATGSYPSRHGVVNNAWWDRERRVDTPATEDESTRIVPAESLRNRRMAPAASASPRMLLVDTLGDRLKRASPQSKVFSISIKDRSAVLMGGHRPDGVFWYDPDARGFVTSTYYGERYPDWLVEFDRAIEVRPPSGNEADAQDPPQDSRQDLYAAKGDDALAFSLAERAIDAERLGRDSAPDLLWISAVQGDRIGHQKGPDGPEMHDYYLRLDGLIGDFLARLDERVGRDHYLLVLTSDHGVRPLLKTLEAAGVDARDLHDADIHSAITETLATVAQREGLPGPVDGLWEDGIVIDPQSLGQVPAERQEAFRSEVAAELRKLPFVADAFTYEELVGTTPSRPYLDAFRRSFHAQRGPDVAVRFPPNYLYSHSRTGHGTPYDYDQRVPIVFVGAGIPAGKREEPVGLVDIAPTVAQLLGLSASDGFDGHALEIERH